MKVKGHKKSKANQVELCETEDCSQLEAEAWCRIINDHTALISLLCTSALSIHHMTNSGAKNGCSLKWQQLWGYCRRHVCHITRACTCRHLGFLTWERFKGVTSTLSTNDYRSWQLQACERHYTQLGVRKIEILWSTCSGRLVRKPELIPTTLHLIDGLHYLFLPQGKELWTSLSWSFQSLFIDQ